MGFLFTLEAKRYVVWPFAIVYKIDKHNFDFAVKCLQMHKVGFRMKPSPNAAESLTQIKDLLKDRTQQIRAERGKRTGISENTSSMADLIGMIEKLCNMVSFLIQGYDLQSGEYKIAKELVDSARNAISEIQRRKKS